jgi:DNA ligase-1
MLAVAAPADGLRFPLLYSAKLDGVRCVVHEGVAKSRKLEPIPNRYVQHMLASPWLEGLDGELCVGAPYSDTVFTDTMSGVMSVNGEPDFVYYVFDCWNAPASFTFADRYAQLLITLSQEPYTLHPRLQLLEQTVAKDMDSLVLAQEDHLERGYEGLILRDPLSPYKFGRSTLKEGFMMKMKRFVTGEARVVDMTEMMHNENEALDDALGLAKRSQSAEGMVPSGALGALIGEDLVTGQRIRVGSGFTAQQRMEYFTQPSEVMGKVFKYKHFEIGAKDAPRFATFIGFRDIRDIGEPT